MESLLKLLKRNARLSNSELAVMLGKSEEEIASEIERLEQEGIIKGYSTILSESAALENSVTAYIELKVSPKAQSGFDEIARAVGQYDEVENVWLMSGAYDLGVTVKGKTLLDVSLFVSQRLAPLDGILSTATHFVLKKYKDNGVDLSDEIIDERGLISP